MILKEHHKEFAIKAIAKFMTGTKGTEVPLIRGLRAYLINLM